MKELERKVKEFGEYLSRELASNKREYRENEPVDDQLFVGMKLRQTEAIQRAYCDVFKGEVSLTKSG